MTTLIKNIRLVLRDGIKEGLYVLVNDNKILDIVASSNIDNIHFDDVIDGEGRYLAPGFIDIHHHGNSGYDTMDASHEALTEMSVFQAKHGVTSFLATTMTNPNFEISKALDNACTYIKKTYKNPNCADLLGVYLEGPYFSIEKKGAQPKEFIKNGNIDEIENYIKIANDHISVLAIAPELEGSIEIIKKIKSKGVKVALGHSNANYEETISGIDAGANIATHLYNGMKSFSHREPAIVGGVLTDDRIYAELIVDMHHLHKAAIQLAYKAKGKDKIILVSDAMRATGLTDGKYDLGGQMVEVIDGFARLDNGTIAGSTLTLDKAIKNMVNIVGIPLHEAIMMASYNPAKALGLDHKIGSVEKGKQADLVFLDQNLNVTHVMIKGHLIKK